MSYKQTGPNPGSWPQHGQPLATAGMWQVPSLVNGDVLSQQNAMFLSGRPPFDMGMMGPPPIPQKSANGSMTPNQQMMLPTPFPGHIMAANAFRFPMTDTPLPSNGSALPAGLTGPSPHAGFNDKTTYNSRMQYSPFGNLQNPISQAPHSDSNNWKTSVMDKPPADPPPLDNITPDLDSSKTLEARLNEILNPTPQHEVLNPKAQHSTNRNSWSTKVINPESSLQHEKPVATSINTTIHPDLTVTSQMPSRPNDLKNLQLPMFTGRDIPISNLQSRDGNPPQLAQSDNASSLNQSSLSAATALPHEEELLSALSTAPHVLNMDETSSGSDKDKPKRRRRKRCGQCKPCQMKEDCGQCYVCKNKGQVNAICKSRKCILLRKKLTSTGEPIPRSLPNQAQPSSISSSGDHPTIASSSTAPTAAAKDALHCMPPTLPMNMPSTQELNYYRTQPQNPWVNSLSTPAAAFSTKFTHSKNEIPSNMQQRNVSTPFSTNPLNKPHMKQPVMPWGGPPAKIQGTGWPKNHKNSSVPQKSNTSMSNEKLSDLYSTFKDDMQKMNERTYVRANGVKVCKLMTKLLSLNISDNELKSSEPPKPSLDDWEQFLPDSKTQDGNPLQVMLDDLDDVEPVTDMTGKSIEEVIVPREVISHHTSDPEVSNSQGTTSDVEDAGQALDTQTVDSGFSSSSPADRQSPSPKVMFDSASAASAPNYTNIKSVTSQLVETEPTSRRSEGHSQSVTRSVPVAATQPSGSAPSLSAATATASSNLDSTLSRAFPLDWRPDQFPLNGVKQEQVETVAKATDACVLDLSANSTSFPRLSPDEFHSRISPDAVPLRASSDTFSSHPQSNFNLQPMMSSFQVQQTLNQQTSGSSNHTGSLPPQPQNPMVVSMNNLISSLSEKVTGISNESASQVPEDVRNGNADPDIGYLIKHNKVAEPPKCGCVHKPYDENIEGPYYIHLGSACSIKGIREVMEERTGMVGEAIRIEKVRYTTKEGKTSLGCPAAKWILRRSGIEEKVLVVTKHRPGHYCPTAWLVIAIIMWEGVPAQAANHMYDYLTRTLPVYGYETERRCGTNQPRSCACQGWDTNRKGASFSFGCSWSVYYNGCKFARSQIPRKFKLRDQSFEGVMESKFQALGQHLAPLYQQMAPISYGAQVRYEGKAGDCRVGFRTGRPFSGCTATVDFCAHQHRDTHNMNNGCTVVVTLTKHRGLSKPDDEQLHTLPMYCLDDTDENGSTIGIQQGIANGGLEVLNAFTQEQRQRSRPYKKRKKGTESYQSPKVKEAFMECIKEKLSRDIKGCSSSRLSAAPQDVEAAKQDLFNTRSKPLPPGLHPDVQQQLYLQHPHLQAVHQPAGPFNPSSAVQDSYNRQFTGSVTPGNIQGSMLPVSVTNSQQPSAPAPTQPMQPMQQVMGGEMANRHSMEQHVRQHIQNAQLQQQAAGSSKPVGQTSLFGNPSSSDIGKPSSEALKSVKTEIQLATQQTMASKENSVTVTDIEENEEGLSLPKPRPPSPEYDDPEGKDVHEENVHLFRDNKVGGVALALQHGAVLFEVAKRELHATTALRQPDRYNPTRISLVFYQHKRLNCSKHGFQEYRKAEEERQKAREAARLAGVEYIPKGLKYKQKRLQEAAQRKSLLAPRANPHPTPAKFAGVRKKPGRKVGWKQRKQMMFAAWQYLWPQVVNHPKAFTSNSTVTNWVKPQCQVTGPFKRWVSLHQNLVKQPKIALQYEYKRPPLPTSVSPAASISTLAVTTSLMASTVSCSSTICSTAAKVTEKTPDDISVKNIPFTHSITMNSGNSRATYTKPHNPVASSMNSAASSINPLISSTNPVVSSTNPAISRMNPMVSSTNPAISRMNPVVSSTNAVVSSTHPVVRSTNPVIRSTNPVASRMNPAASRIDSVTGSVNPGAGRMNPGSSSQATLSSVGDSLASRGSMATLPLPMSCSTNAMIPVQSTSNGNPMIPAFPSTQNNIMTSFHKSLGLPMTQPMTQPMTRGPPVMTHSLISAQINQFTRALPTPHNNPMMSGVPVTAYNSTNASFPTSINNQTSHFFPTAQSNMIAPYLPTSSVNSRNDTHTHPETLGTRSLGRQESLKNSMINAVQATYNNPMPFNISNNQQNFKYNSNSNRIAQLLGNDNDTNAMRDSPALDFPQC